MDQGARGVSEREARGRIINLPGLIPGIFLRVEMIEQIKHQINPHSITPKGVYTVACPFCSPKEIKAGFLFDSNAVGYNCFKSKCPIGSARWEMGSALSKNMRAVFDAFDIHIPLEYIKVERLTKTYDPDLYKRPSFQDFSDVTEVRAYDPDTDIAYKNYLEQRHINSKRFLIGTGYIGTNNMKGMLITPLLVHGKLIGLQGRDIYRKRYINIGENAIYIPNNGFIDKTKPVYVVEGIYDAMVLPNAVACLSDTVTPFQAWLLRDINPILVPDRDTSKFLEVGRMYGWRVSIPEYASKDVNEAISEYGELVVAKMLHDGIIDNMDIAKVRYRLWTRG